MSKRGSQISPVTAAHSLTQPVKKPGKMPSFDCAEHHQQNTRHTDSGFWCPLFLTR
jgi:hypothetical protein